MNSQNPTLKWFMLCLMVSIFACSRKPIIVETDWVRKIDFFYLKEAITEAEFSGRLSSRGYVGGGVKLPIDFSVFLKSFKRTVLIMQGDMHSMKDYEDLVALSEDSGGRQVIQVWQQRKATSTTGDIKIQRETKLREAIQLIEELKKIFSAK